MNVRKIEKLLKEVAAGRLSVARAMDGLRVLPFENLGFARLDSHRELRRGFPEVVFGERKTIEQIATIVERLASRGQAILVTRVGPETWEAVAARVPGMSYNAAARALYRHAPGRRKPIPGIAVLSAGTSDLPVAEEAALTAEVLGNRVERIFDVGVAGLHRLAAEQERLFAARVLVVVAGMEGALPSVVSGLVDAPVIAVPTSVGYGASFGGLAALLGMLNSCSSGVAVVNIDNGFGAGYTAALINRKAARRRTLSRP
jgi:hypothetical protein